MPELAEVERLVMYCRNFCAVTTHACPAVPAAWQRNSAKARRSLRCTKMKLEEESGMGCLYVCSMDLVPKHSSGSFLLRLLRTSGRYRVRWCCTRRIRGSSHREDARCRPPQGQAVVDGIRLCTPCDVSLWHVWGIHRQGPGTTFVQTVRFDDGAWLAPPWLTVGTQV